MIWLGLYHHYHHHHHHHLESGPRALNCRLNSVRTTERITNAQWRKGQDQKVQSSVKQQGPAKFINFSTIIAFILISRKLELQSRQMSTWIHNFKNNFQLAENKGLILKKWGSFFVRFCTTACDGRIIFNLTTKWRWMVSFMLRKLNSRENKVKVCAIYLHFSTHPHGTEIN